LSRSLMPAISRQVRRLLSPPSGISSRLRRAARQGKARRASFMTISLKLQWGGKPKTICSAPAPRRYLVANIVGSNGGHEKPYLCRGMLTLLAWASRCLVIGVSRSMIRHRCFNVAGGTAGGRGIDLESDVCGRRMRRRVISVVHSFT